MKIFKNVPATLLKACLYLAFVAPMFSSCVDGDEIWDKIEEIEGRLDSLEKGLNGQIEAMTALLKGGNITIAKCSQNENGSYTIKLSNGTEFTVLHKNASNKPLLSYVIENNVKYWAMYDKDGALNPLVDGAGKKIPVSAAVPSIVEKDGAYYLVIDGKEYITGYVKGDDVSVITDYEVNADESGNVYSVSFKIGDETFTLTVDGYKGFTFMLGNSMAGGTMIKDLFVDFNSTYQITAGLDGVVDYVMQIPDGWRVKETKDETSGDMYLDITAPSKEIIASGAAVASGDLKVVAVLEGGDAMVAKLELTTVPFKTIKLTSTHAVVEKYNGVDKIVFGLTKYSEYDEETIFAGASALLNANDKGVSEKDINMLLSDILGEELAAGEAYMFWVIPAFYEMDEEKAGYYVKEGMIYSQSFGATVVKLEVSDIVFNDAKLDFSIAGADSYYGGTTELTETAMTEILFRINNDMMDPVTSPLSYKGSAFAFPTADASEDVEIKSLATYISWVIPVVEGKVNYEAADVLSTQFTLTDVTPGGSIKVDASAQAQTTKVSVSVPLSAPGASRIYYVFLTESAAKRHADDASRASYLLKYGTVVEGSSATAFVENVQPGSKRVLFSMATDASGKYGPVQVTEYQTEALTYNDLEVTLEVGQVGQNTATVNVSVAGGDAAGYVFWAGKQTEEFWIDMSGSNANEKAASAQEHIALYPDDSAVERAMRLFTLENGVLNMTDLKGNTTYQVVVMAKDAQGNYSQAGHAQFTTLAVDLGTIVTSDSDTWKQAKEQVVITWHENKFRTAANSNMSAFYAFDIKVPTNLTAYILCMTEEYFEANPETQTLEDKIIDIETQCSRKYDAGKVTYGPDGGYAEEPDWIDDDGNLHEGQLLNVYDFYVHGYPTNGFATYFATGSHGADNCTEWESGECSNYAYALQHIKKRLTVDYYKEYFKEQKGLKIQSVIDKAAQDYYEAYYPYYKDAKPLIYENTGEALYMENHYASGPNDENVVPDDVFVVFKDAQGNYYEPMSFEVPNYFK